MSTFVLPNHIISYVYPQGDQQSFKKIKSLMDESNNILP